MDIRAHPIWKGILSYKKPLHLLRIHLVRQYVKLYPISTFIGVTGSVGKTSCVQACQLVLSQKFKTIATRPNLDPVFNIPLTLLQLNPSVKRAILEMGIEYKGEMDFYLSIVRPKTAIITRIYYAHSEFLGNLDEILEEKGKLVEQLPGDGVAILNWDDVYSKKLSQKCQGTVIYFGKDSKNCEIWVGNIRIEDFKTIFELNYGAERVEINYQLLGEHQVYPALAAAALGIVEEISLIRIKKALEEVTPSEHRLQPLLGPRGAVILDDTYNSSPAAVEAAIDTLLQIPARRRIVVLGEMRELGWHSESLHRQIARKVYKDKIDLVLLGQGDTKYVADELQQLGFLEEKLKTNLQNPQIVTKLLKVLEKGDLCLIKGSRAIRLDEVVRRVTKAKR